MRQGYVLLGSAPLGTAGLSLPPPPPVQASYEERLLEERFGAEYAEYKKSTKKLLPYIY